MERRDRAVAVGVERKRALLTLERRELKSKKRSVCRAHIIYNCTRHYKNRSDLNKQNNADVRLDERKTSMSKENDNKAIVGRWFTDFWGETCNLGIVDELAAPDMLLQYSLHAPRRGHEDIKAFSSGFREAFPDLNFSGAADLIADADYG